MKDQKNSTVKLLEERIQDLKAEVKCYPSTDPSVRVARRELRSLESKLKHNKRKS